jgi:hypothetical protein
MRSVFKNFGRRNLSEETTKEIMRRWKIKNNIELKEPGLTFWYAAVSRKEHVASSYEHSG